MFKVIFLSIISLVFIGCSSESSSSVASSQSSTKLTISKAPASSVVSIFQTFSLAVSSRLDETTVNSSTVYIKDSLSNIIGSEVVLETPDNLKLNITPFQYLSPSTTYTLVVTTGLKNELGQSLSKNYEYTFTTLADSSNPGTQINLVKTNPSNGVTAAANTHIAFEFDRFIAPSATPPFSIVDLNTSQTISGEIKYFNSSIIFEPSTPLSASHQIGVTFDGTPTDMYGNDFNASSGGSFTFNIEAAPVSASTWAANPVLNVATGMVSQKIRYIGSVNIDEYIAVAREGGVDIYTHNIEAIDAEKWSAQPVFTLNIASNITDMVYTGSLNNEFLLISTAEDGIFVLNVGDKAASISVNQYMQNVGFIYGIGFSQSNGYVDRVYAVGPTIGMYVFSSDVSGNLTQLTSVAIAGTPLKVTSLASVNNYVFVSDYDNGVRIYDRDGTSVDLLPMSTPVKHMIEFNDTLSNILYVTDSLGYIYSNDADSYGNMNSYEAMSYTIEDLQLFSNSQTVCFSLDDNGLYCDGYYGASDFYLDKAGIVSATEYMSGIITLTKDGVIDVFTQN